jgi:hypothetical protein
MTQNGSHLVVVVHKGELVERVSAIHPNTNANFLQLHKFLNNGDGTQNVPPEEKDIISGGAEDFRWLSLRFDQFWMLVEQKKISVEPT